MSTPTQLEKQIIATVVYYDILNYPLTSFEIFLYLINDIKSKDNKYLLSDIIETLDDSEFLKNNLNQKLGFYFLNGRSELVQERLDRKNIADQKWKKSKNIFWIMQIIPFTKLVMGSGSFSLGNTKKESDVDLMIVAKWGRIWTVRTFFTLLTSLLRVRRHKDKTEDMICLNHYITDKSLRIPFESLYTAQLYYHILSIYNSKEDRKMFRKFQKENKWMKKYLENYEFSQLESLRSIKRNKMFLSISKIFEFMLAGKIGEIIEKTLSSIQSKKIKRNSLYKKSGGRITIDNSQLEFHPNSQENYIISEFNKRIKKIGLLEFGEQKDSGLNI